VKAFEDGSETKSDGWTQKTIAVANEGWAIGYEWMIPEDRIAAAENGVVGQAFFVFPFAGSEKIEIRSMKPKKHPEESEHFSKSGQGYFAVEQRGTDSVSRTWRMPCRIGVAYKPPFESFRLAQHRSHGGKTLVILD
jgi:hypothetical protein